VLVTVVNTRGSTPRELGAKMTVGERETWDTIGGGQLEHAIIESARFLLEGMEDGYSNTMERHVLGPSHGQCCGGTARLLLERIPGGRQDWIDALVRARRENRRVFVATRVGGADKQVLDPAGAPLPDEVKALAQRVTETGKSSYDRDAGWFVDVVTPLDFHIVLFGAGHVGKALAHVLATLHCNLTWIDSRASQLPGESAANVRIETTRSPELLVDNCPPHGFYLVMTHSHPIDLAICERILKRDDFAYCGLIGSRPKRRHFEKSLRSKGITEAALNRLTCPIGIEGITGKRPAEIAIAVAAEILKLREAARMDAL
jgi:xanthine dehydrogenase accessory factor